MPNVHYRTCNLCEAMCGLVIKTEGQEILSIAGDAQDPFSRGHVCPKAVALKDIYEDPNRLRTPVRRTPTGWEPISWEEAMNTIETRLKNIQQQYGKNAVGLYQGNPSIHNLGTMMNSPAFAKSLGSKNIFSATSTDQLPHHFASWLMFGHPMLLPVPDIDHTQYLLIFGANPYASNGSMMTAPDVAKRLQAIQERGGKVVVIDPRKTETAKKASEHHTVQPGADVLVLLAMLHTLFAEQKIDLGRLGEFVDGVDDIAQLVQDFSPQQVAPATGMDAATIQRLALEFAAAPSAVAYGRVGVSTQAFGSLCQWLINVLNIVTGNLDRVGGACLPSPQSTSWPGHAPATALRAGTRAYASCRSLWASYL